MSNTKKGWDRSLAMSFFTKEASYDAGTAMAAANACSLSGFEADVVWADRIVNDRDGVPPIPTTIGSNLIAGWSNVDYDTFTSSGANITSAIRSTAGTKTATCTEITTLATYKRYKIVATLTLNSGAAPALSGTGGVPTTTLASGATSIEFEATGASCVLTVTNAAVGNWACTFTLYLLKDYEQGNDQEIVAYGLKINYKEQKCKPNTLAGLGALALGSTTPTQDPGKTAYVHKIVPVAVGTALPSIQVMDLNGDLQYTYKGVKCNTLKLSGESGGHLALEAELIGSGTRAESDTAFPAVISESWMQLANCKVWFETGTDISITSGALTQAAENISGDTPDDFYPRMKNFEFNWDNALEGQEGFGGANVYQDIDYGRRKAALKLTMIFNDGTELAYFTAQSACAIEFDLKGALIATGGTMYYGMSLVIPRMKIKSPAPLPKGGPNDTLIQDFDLEIFDDGTNSAVRIDVYNAQAAYLA